MTKHRVKEQLVVHGPQCLARFIVQPSGTHFQLLLFSSLDQHDDFDSATVADPLLDHAAFFTHSRS